MQLALELLAPAKNLSIGTAAIDCGADAVYMAGPAFGARVAAGNPVSDIEKLCRYAHLYGARVYATINTLIDESCMDSASRLINEYYEAGVDALIVQDMRLLTLDLPPIELHASTQCVIRTPERAVELEKAGFRRIILERQLSLDQIRAIREKTTCEIEFFVHGALCVCYSGQCYLSEELTGRSANKGCCAQPCRSRFDLADGSGKILMHDRPLLSLKDFRLDGHIGELAACGVSSFKIEGRLKNASYVKNVVRHYRNVLDNFMENNPQYAKSSYGTISGGFSPKPEATFNRGFTSCWIEGKRGQWNSGDAAKSIGEFIGVIRSVNGNKLNLATESGIRIVNGDGLSFVAGADEITGMRCETSTGSDITVKNASGLSKGMKVYRNLNLKFEHELEKNMPRRLLKAAVFYSSKGGTTTLLARSETGTEARLSFNEDAVAAEKPERALETLEAQINKSSGPFVFHLEAVESDTAYFYPASRINCWRRELAEMLIKADEKRGSNVSAGCRTSFIPENIKREDGELMRTKYCIRWELGICPRQNHGKDTGPLYLVNQNRKLSLHFDCKNCEMTVTL